MAWHYGLAVIFGFFSGSIMYSYLLPKLFCGVDIIQEGEDHNPGTANAMKHAGVFIGAVCLLLDLAKGFFPVYLCAKWLDSENVLFAFVLAAPVLGHAFSPFLKGQGGKAIATTFGALLGVAAQTPMVIGLILILLFFTFVVTIKPNALRVIIGFSLFFVYCLLHVRIPSMRIGGMLICAVVLGKHLHHFDHERAKVGIFLVDAYRKRKEEG